MQKNNKTTIIIAGVAILLTVFLLTFFRKSEKKVSEVIDAIPPNSAVIFEINNANKLIGKIKNNSSYFKILAKANFLIKDFEKFKLLDSVIDNNDNVKSFLKNRKIIISGHSVSKNKIEYLFLTSVNKRKAKQIKEELAHIFLKGGELSTKEYSKTEIFRTNFKNSKNNISYCVYDGFFVMSFSDILLEKAIRYIGKGGSLSENKNFNEIYQASNDYSILKVFINYEYISDFLGETFDNKKFKELKFIQDFADWTVLDVTFAEKSLQLSGHTSLKEEAQYLSIFKNQNPKSIDLFRIFPEKTSTFAILNISDGEIFKFKYQDFLNEIIQSENYQLKLHNLTILVKDIDFYNLVNNEIALVFEDVNKNGENYNKFAFIHTDKPDEVKQFFKLLIANFAKKKKENKDKYYSKYVSNGRTYQITELPQKDIPYIYFGSIFKDISAKYFTIIDDYIAFAENKTAIEELISSYENQETFVNKSSEKEFINTLPSESNIFLYTNIFHGRNVINKVLKSKSKKVFNENIDELRTVQSVAVQYIVDSYPIYTNCVIAFDKSPEKTNETVWETKLDNIPITKPFSVINHNTNEKEIFIQDAEKKIYLIDKNGIILWKRQVSERIMGAVHQIDFYKNNKLQILFNTKNAIHLIDRKGNYVENYPVSLRSPATSPIAVFDYDFDKNYRILIATNNNKVSLYNKKGELLEGWKFGKTKQVVRKPAKHFKNDNKDYIVFFDENDMYVVNRRGESRFKVPSFSIAKNSEIFYEPKTKTSEPRFVTTSPKGSVYFISLEGKVKKLALAKVSENHFFSYEDITNNGYNEFIYTDGIQTSVYDRDLERKFSYIYGTEISQPHKIYKFSKDDVRIGVVSEKENKIYLINSDGTTCKDFPLRGHTLFTISQLSKSKKFSLITGGNISYLYKYNIK